MIEQKEVKVSEKVVKSFQYPSILLHPLRGFAAKFLECLRHWALSETSCNNYCLAGEI